MTGYLAPYDENDMKNLVQAREYLRVVETARIRDRLDRARQLPVCIGSDAVVFSLICDSSYFFVADFNFIIYFLFVIYFISK
jgi:hypothetical protein